MKTRTLSLILLLIGGCASSSSQSNTTTLRKDPLHQLSARSTYERGVDFLKQGDYTRAEQYLVAAMQQGYPERVALPLVVKACLLASRYHAGLEHAKPYLVRHPANWRLRYLVASLYMAVGSPEEAKQQLQKVIQSQPNEALPHYLLGALLRDQGHHDAAANHFARYVQLEPKGLHVEEATAAPAEPTTLSATEELPAETSDAAEPRL